MKLSNWAILISSIILLFFIMQVLMTTATRKQATESTELTMNLAEAMYGTALESSWNFDDENSRLNFAKVMTDKLASALGYADYGEASIIEMSLNVPVVALCMEDGYWLYFTDIYTNADGNTMYTKIMSPKIVYSNSYGLYNVLFSMDGQVTVIYTAAGISTTTKGYCSEVFIKLGRPTNLEFLSDIDKYKIECGAVIAKLVGSSLRSSITEHLYSNTPLDSYQISAPSFQTDSVRSITSKTVIAMYQAGSNRIGTRNINIYTMAAAELQESAKYIVLNETVGTQNILTYHIGACTHTGQFVMRGNKDDCERAGAKRCTDCIP